MPHLVAAPDKFRGTVSAAVAASAMADAARRCGWSADAVPMSDGGEGLLESIGGKACFTTVPDALGRPISAEWRLLAPTESRGATAVIEMARAAGRVLLPHPSGDDPVRADTKGLGHLLLAARDAGATHIIVGCGGSATTDGGWGAVEVVGSAAQLSGISVVVACDVTTAFGDAARVYGPQKGATPEQVEWLSTRLAELAQRYAIHYGFDVTSVPGAGAAGGLAGGLAVLGAELVPGFDLVADVCGLEARIAACDLVVTGEGHLDPPSFAGKVPGGVVALAAGGPPVLIVVGAADPAVLAVPRMGVEIVSLTEQFGAVRARAETVSLIGTLTESALHRFCT